MLRTAGAQKWRDQRLPEKVGQGTEAPPPQEIGRDPIRNSTKDRQALGYK